MYTVTVYTLSQRGNTNFDLLQFTVPPISQDPPARTIWVKKVANLTSPTCPYNIVGNEGMAEWLERNLHWGLIPSFPTKHQSVVRGPFRGVLPLCELVAELSF